MRSDFIPRKTEHAREVLKNRAFPGTRAQRLFLITVDGRQPMTRLGPIAQSLGIDDQDVRALVDAGLIEWIARPRSTAAVANEQSGATLQAVAARVVAEDDHAAAAETIAADRRIRTLAAAKMYALDLASLMLIGQDREVRMASREVVDEAQLRGWLLDTATRIAAVASEERATVFLEKVRALLPPGTAIAENQSLPLHDSVDT